MVGRDSVNPGSRVASPTMAAGGNGAAPRTGRASAAEGEDLVVLERVEGDANKIATSILGEGPGSAGPLLNPDGTVQLQALPVAESCREEGWVKDPNPAKDKAPLTMVE